MNDDRERQLRDLLKGYCEKVPPAINNASIQKVLDFKAAVKAGTNLLKKSRANEGQLTSAINLLHTFW